MIDWIKISNKIYSYTKDTLQNGSPSYNEDEIKEGIKIFYDTIICKLGYAELDGLSKILLKPLQDVLIDNPIELNSLAVISTNVEAFLKRVILLTGTNTYSNIKDKTLIPLLKEIGINTALSSQAKSNDYPVLDEINLGTYSGCPEYLEYICLSYITRNNVHLSVDMGFKESVNRLEALLVLYLFIVLSNKNSLKVATEVKLSSVDGTSLNSIENKWLYDFMTYGNSTAEVKTQIIDAYILNSIFDFTSKKKSDLMVDIISYFDTDINAGFINRRISKLQTDKRIVFNKEDELITLTSNESERLMHVRQNFKENRDLFFLYYDDIIVKYNIEAHKNILLENLKELLIDNFNLDLAEIYENGYTDLNSQYLICSNFIIKYLCTIVGNRATADLLMKDLLSLSIDSDFLLCLSASSVFNSITDTVKYQNFINQPIKEVFIDTQIVLYSLCLDFRRNDSFDNLMYRITKELCMESKASTDIKLLFSIHYISEISFQLKNALNLIAFGDLLEKYDGKLSSNIFYQFYISLKKSNLLGPEYHFADFMEECLSLYEDDVYEKDFVSICESAIKNKLNETGYIEIRKIPTYNTNDIELLIESTIEKDKLPTKSHYILKNDAIMLAYLSDEDNHANEPFFLTWDKSFINFRKSYFEKYLRRSTFIWHIFSPSKFINHLALMKVHLNPKMISDDFLSVIDSFGLTKKTRSVYDNHNRFLDIKNISKDLKYKYIKILQDLFSDFEFGYEQVENTSNSQIFSVNYEGALDAINQYYYGNSKYSIIQYRLMLLQEDYFIQVANFIKTQIINDSKKIETIDYIPFLKSIDSLIKESIEKQTLTNVLLEN